MVFLFYFNHCALQFYHISFYAYNIPISAPSLECLLPTNIPKSPFSLPSLPTYVTIFAPFPMPHYPQASLYRSVFRFLNWFLVTCSLTIDFYISYMRVEFVYLSPFFWLTSLNIIPSKLMTSCTI